MRAARGGARRVRHREPGLQQRSVPVRRRERARALRPVSRSAEDARPAGRLLGLRPRSALERLRDSARVPLPEAALRADPGPRRPRCRSRARSPTGGSRTRSSCGAGVRFASDPCFALGEAGRTQRELVAADLVFALQRIADPNVGSPVLVTFSKIVGLAEFGKRLAKLREDDPAFASLRIDQQYAARRPDRGLELESHRRSSRSRSTRRIRRSSTGSRCRSRRRCRGRRSPTTTARRAATASPIMPSARDPSASRATRSAAASCSNATPTGTAQCIPSGARPPQPIRPKEQRATRKRVSSLPRPPAARCPSSIASRCASRRRRFPSSPSSCRATTTARGFPRRASTRRRRGARSRRRWRRSACVSRRTVTLGIYYVGFNMDDPVVGSAAGERGRKLRQAMSLAIDADEFLRVFLNGRGIPAQSPLPPGLFGYEAELPEPVPQRRSRARARACSPKPAIRTASIPRPAARCTSPSTPATPSVQARLRYQFLVESWRRLGLDVEIAATSYNQFQDKVRRGAYQLFFWGWVADYPDPENFLFLLWGPMGQTRERRSQLVELRRPALRRALRRDEESRQRRRAAGHDPARCARCSSASGRGSSSSIPRTTRSPRAGSHNAKATGLTVPIWKYYDVGRGDARRTPRRVEPAGALAGLRPRGSRRGAARAGRRDLPAGASLVLAYLLRRTAWGVATVLGVLLFLFALFFLYATPRRRRAPGARREGAAGRDRAVDREPRLRQARRVEPGAIRSTRSSPSTCAGCCSSTSAAATPTTCRSRSACATASARVSA